MTYIITKLSDDWYSFGELPQGENYIKIDALRCSTDRKAINRARKILGNKKAIIKIMEEREFIMKKPTATLKNDATYKEVKQYLKDLKDEGFGDLAKELKKRIKSVMFVGLPNLTKKDKERL